MLPLARYVVLDNLHVASASISYPRAYLLSRLRTICPHATVVQGQRAMSTTCHPRSTVVQERRTISACHQLTTVVEGQRTMSTCHPRAMVVLPVRTLCTGGSGGEDYYVHHQHGNQPRLHRQEKRLEKLRNVESFKADDLHPSDVPEPVLTEAELSALKSARILQPEGSDELFKSIDIETRGHDPAVLSSYLTFALSAAGHLGLTVVKQWSPKEIFWHRTLLKSVHVHKKARVQYATKTFFQCFRIDKLTGSTASTYLEYIQRNLPEGVAMKVTKREVRQLPEFVVPKVEGNLEETHSSGGKV